MRPLVFVPTYNERDNVSALCDEILGLGLDLDLLFLDDASPDGTGEVLDGLARKHSNVRVIHRSGKLGVGSAHQTGIAWAYDHGYRILITMDCDFTHPPAYIPDFLKLADQARVVVGSRHLRDDSLTEWDPVRLFLTKFAHRLTKALLSVPQDATGAYRLYRLDLIPRELFSLVKAASYPFFFESLFILNSNGVSIKEIPIVLPIRTRGHSKMTLGGAFASAAQLTNLALSRLVNRSRFLLPSKGSAEREAPSQEWDRYWSRKEHAAGLAFNLAAAFYRRFIIRRTLNRFLFANFPAGSELVHAGCGGGQVDVDVTRAMKVTALDISVKALEKYRQANAGRGRLLHGDILEIPLADSSADGVYNLGVMEHLTQDEIQKALGEFGRILRPGGRIVLFWPPSFGPTVLFLDAVHFLLNKVLRLGVKLHPDEISRVRSRSQIRSVVERAGLNLETFYWGPMDLFTHAILVISKGRPA